VSVQLDRASTNKAAIVKVKESYPDANSKEMYCISHGLNNVGMKLFEHAQFVEEFRKLYQGIIQYPGKARDHMKMLIKLTVKLSQGIRFFQKFEQVYQITTQGMKAKIIDQLLPFCIERKYSETSSFLY
jgi:hypothetical protein